MHLMCFQKLQMLFLMHKVSQLWEPLKVVFCILWTRPYHCLITSLLSGTISHPNICIFCLRPGTDHFSKEPYFYWWLQSGFATSTLFAQPVNVTKDSIFLNPMVIFQFPSDLIYLWLLTWLVTHSLWKCFLYLASKNTILSWSFFSLLTGPLLSPLCWLLVIYIIF